MLLSQLCDFMAVSYLLLNITLYDEMSADWLILQGLRGMGGYNPVFFAMTTAMITDIAPAKWLTVRITFAQHFNRHIGQVVGASVY